MLLQWRQTSLEAQLQSTREELAAVTLQWQKVQAALDEARAATAQRHTELVDRDQILTDLRAQREQAEREVSTWREKCEAILQDVEVIDDAKRASEVRLLG